MISKLKLNLKIVGCKLLLKMNFRIENLDKSKKLALFDFDYTIVNLNSNNYVNKLVIKRNEQLANKGVPIKSSTPSIAKMNRYKFPQEIEELADRYNYTVNT